MTLCDLIRGIDASVTKAPFTRYNMLSNRLLNVKPVVKPFDNRLYRVNGV